MADTSSFYKKISFFLVFTVLCGCGLFAKEYNKSDVVATVNEMISKSSVPTPADLRIRLNNANSSDVNSFSEKELEELVGATLAFVAPQGNYHEDDKRVLREMQSSLAAQLKDYKVTGVSYAVDPNWAFFVETQNPELNVAYKDSKGNVKTRKYKAQIKTAGLKIELAVKFDLILFVGTDMDFYNSDKEIVLGTGVDSNILTSVMRAAVFARENKANLEALRNCNGNLSSMQWTSSPLWKKPFNWLGLGITYVPFKNLSGGMLIFGMPVGWTGFSFSLVRGGTLTPIES